MSRRIELTWKTNEGIIVVEECLLCDEDDPLFIVGTSEQLTVETPLGTGSEVGLLMSEMVMFEDDVGLFGVPPENVIYIKEL